MKKNFVVNSTVSKAVFNFKEFGLVEFKNKFWKFNIDFGKEYYVHVFSYDGGRIGSPILFVCWAERYKDDTIKMLYDRLFLSISFWDAHFDWDGVFQLYVTQNFVFKYINK
jgi:hypothetical protein